MSSTTAGRDYIVRDLSSRYNPVLSANGDRLTWAWNMRQSRSNPSGFDGNYYGNAFVLAASAADLTNASTTGYAVVIGNSNTPDPIRLVRFSGGLIRNSNLTEIFSTTTDYGTQYLTLRVTYFPGDDSWTLEATASTTSFEDPTTTTKFVTLGTGTDNTYTSASLPYLGCLWNHATSATDNAVFDNIYLTAPCTLTAEPTVAPTSAVVDQLTSSSARLSFVAGNGVSRLVVVRASQAVSAAPTDAAAYAASATYGAGGAVAPGEYAVLAGPATSVSIAGLAPATMYYYRVFEANGTGCSLNYLQGDFLSGSFTSAPCGLASLPTQPSQEVSVTGPAVGKALSLKWEAGTGTGRLVVVRPDQPVVSRPTDGTVYSANSRYGAGAALSSDEFVVYAGTGTSLTVEGLTAGRPYHVAVFEYNGTGCSVRYFTPPVTGFGTPVAPPPVVGYRFYRGNLHAHSGYSDGNKDAATSGAATPADSYTLAREARQMDFLGISEHNHSQAGMSLPNYARGVAQAAAATMNGEFVALYGMEWGTISGGGHVIIYGYDKLLGWEAGNYDVYVEKGNYTQLFATLAEQPGAVAYLAHPEATDYNNLLRSPFNATTGQVLVGSAVRSGPAFSTATDYSDLSSSSFESRYRDALRIGYHLGPTIDHDSHYSVFGRSTTARLVVQAAALSRAGIEEALAARRFFASDDDNVEVTLQVGTAPMGSVLSAVGPPTLKVNVTDPDAADAVTAITLYSGIPGGETATVLTTQTGSATLSFTDNIPDLATYYYYAVVTQVDGHKIWTAPIRYTRQDELGAPLPVALTNFQAVLRNQQTAVLRWTTASETGSSWFVVERSRDGQRFTEAARVPGAGTTARVSTYELADPQPLTAPTYYRLRQLDADGSVSFSSVVRLTLAAREPVLVNVYPNPVSAGHNLQLAVRGLSGASVAVELLDVLGRPVARQQLAVNEYLTDLPFSLPAGLRAGVYLVRMTDGHQVWTQRVTLQ